MPYAPKRLGLIAIKAHEPQRATSKATVLSESATRTSERNFSITPIELHVAATTHRPSIEDLTGMSIHVPSTDSDSHLNNAVTSAYGRLGTPDDARQRRADHVSGIEGHRGG